MSRPDRVPTDGGQAFGHNPFGALSSEGLSPAPEGLPENTRPQPETMQKACGTGGTVKNGQIEIQGDKRAEVARILTEANFRPVFAGG
ncbi:MAG: translation initiation factor [Verrucomicrobia bacterium]|nr:translation initiation factor [Verrucomicrobiota bacterium]